ncbi:MAG: MTH1187 family thiamine-binding protein [Candidatus Hadarchaeia archaeon]
MAVVEVTVIPIGTKGPSLSKYVSRAVEIAEDSDVSQELTPSGTILEGDLGDVLKVVRKMHESVFNDEISRVVTNIEIDDRRDKKLSMEGKKNSVKRKLK